jgi:hypothetical protein
MVKRMMNANKGRLLLAITTLVAFFLVACSGNTGADSLFRVTNSGKVGSEDSLDYDLGDINIKGGMVRRTATFINNGKEDLILKGAFTSCMCTTADIELMDGRISGEFGTKLSTKWHEVIKPGERFKVNIVFDPLFHGEDDVGPFKRTVYLITSAPPDDRLSTTLPMIKYGTVTTIRFSGNVLSEKDFKTTTSLRVFNEALGDFRFAETEHDFGVIKQSQGVVKYGFPFVYSGESPITIEGTPTSCGCTKAFASVKRLAPGEEGILTVEFDPNLHEEPEGKFFKTIAFLTDPVQEERVELRIWAQIDLDLGPDAYKLKGHKEEDEDHEEDNDEH